MPTYRSFPVVCLLSVLACSGDDAGDDTTVGMTTVPTTTADGSSGTAADTTGGGASSGTPTSGGSGGPDPSAVCNTCDYTTEYCVESIIDGPSEYFCRDLPEACLQDITCDCVVAIECENVQSCGDVGGEVRLHCVEG